MAYESNSESISPSSKGERDADVVKGSGLGNLISKGKSVFTAIEARTKSGDELVDYLKTRLDKNLKAQLTSNLTIRRQSVKEMNFLKNEIYRGNLALSQKNRDLFHGLYNRAIEESVKTNSALAQRVSEFADSVKGRLPSLENVLSAVSVANPVVGFGLKLTKDLISTARSRKTVDEEERKAKIQSLDDELLASMNQTEAATKTQDTQDAQLEMAAESHEEEKKIRKQKAGERVETQKEWLIRIHGAIEKLADQRAEIVAGTNQSMTSIERTDKEESQSLVTGVDDKVLIDHQNRVENKLEKVEDNTGKLVKLQEKGIKEQEMQRLSDIEDSRAVKTTGIKEVPNIEDKAPGGIMSMLTGFIMGKGGVIAKLGGALMIFLKPLLALGAGLISLAKFIPGVALIGSVIAAGMSFFNGFKNAGEILDKHADDLTVTDKIAAGLGSIVGMLGGIVDWFAGLLGFDLNLKEQLTKYVSQSLAGIFDKFKDIIDAGINAVVDMHKMITGAVDSMIEWGVDKVKGILPEFLTDKIFGKSSPTAKESHEIDLADAEATGIRIQRMSTIEAMTFANDRANATAGNVIVAPTSNASIDNSSNSSINMPRSTRNDDSTLRSMQNRAMAHAH
jgi:hypothetical protein